MLTRFTRAASSLTVVALAVSGCSLVDKFKPGDEDPASSAGSSSEPGADGGIYRDVTLAPAARIVKAKPRISGSTYRFARGASGVADLRPGSAMVVAGVAVRKVVSVHAEGGETVVDTTDARLNEVIKDGTVGWNRTIDWSQLPQASFQQAVADAGLRPVVMPAVYRKGVTSSGFSYSGKVGGYAVTFSLTPTADGKLSFSLVAKTKNTGITGKGWLSPFRTETKVVYKAGEGRVLETVNRGLKGEGTLEWAAVGHGSSAETAAPSFSLPFKVPIPIAAGPLPFTLTVSSTIRFGAALMGQSFSAGSYRATWDSDTGFAVKDGKSTPVSQLREASLQPGERSNEAGGWVPVAFGWGWEFPRFEMALVGLPGSFAYLALDLWAVNTWRGGALDLGEKPCEWMDVRVSAVTGAKLSLLGFFSIDVKKKLWEKTIRRYGAGNACAPDEKKG